MLLAMVNFLASSKRSLFLRAVLLVPLVAGSYQCPLRAAQIGSPATAEFDELVVAPTCSFSGGTGGILGISEDLTTIATNVGAGANAQFTVTINRAGTLVADSPVLTRSVGDLQSISTSSVLLNGEAKSSVVLASGSNAVGVGVTFTATSPFEAATYDTSITLTCTDDGTF